MAMTSNLCQLCKTIPLQDLPRFPDESYIATLTGRQHLQRLIHKDSLDDIPGPLGFHHHETLESLRTASASGCELCQLIEAEADALLADIAERNLEYSQFPDVLARIDSDPCFDLWVTARPEGGDGLWIITKSASRPDKELFVVATLNFAFAYDDPLASTFRGRPVKGSPDQTVLDHVASWVTQCNDAHDGCTSRDSSLPTRIIDVGIFDAESLIKLVEVDEGTKGNYIALSYCWGVGTNHFTTSQESLLARKTGIHLGDLPQTFQDAIVMTRLLGVTYLWIDSICICQDDLADWERESARMASVYSNAYLTIAATGQSSSLGGLFFERPLKTFLRLPFMTPGGKGGHVLLSSLDKAKEVIKSYRTEMRSEPLAERAWAFQERVLARRVIHFASDQVSFECLEGSIYEDGLKLPDRYHSVYLKNPAEFITDGDQVSHRSRTGAVQKPKDYWNALLWIYGSRKLTYPADKLPALAGITKVYSQLMDDEYIAGIWRKSMVEGLCWQSLKCTAASGPYRAPSWSWASVDGIPATGFRADPECLATILDYRVDVDGDNPFGRVKSGWIKIEAPFVPLTLAENTGPMGHMLLKPEEGGEEVFAGFDTIDRLYSVSAGMVREMKLFALIMARVTVPKQKPNSEQSSQGVYQSLIVTPAETVESSAIPFREMKRVGMLLQSAETLKADELEDSRTTVTLV